MLTYIRTICSLLIIQLSSSCGHSAEKNPITIVDIESNMRRMEIINLSQFTDNILYVPLETIENLPFAWIYECAFSDSLILVTDMTRCFLYNNKGKFITNIGSMGRGPGEFQFAMKIGFDNKKYIYLQSLYDLLEYNKDGSFINRYKNSFKIYGDENKYVTTWLIFDDSLFFGHVPNTTGKIENKALIVNKRGDIKHSYKNYILFERERTVASGFEDHAHVYKFRNSIFYKEFYNDTLFYLTNHYKLVPRYAFNLGKFKEPVSERAMGAPIAKYVYIWNVFQTENFLLINCQFGEHFPARRLTPIQFPAPESKPLWFSTTNVLGIFNKQTEQLVFCMPTNTDNPLFTSGIYNDIDGGPRFFPTKQVNDSTLAMWMNAKDLKNHVASDDFKNSVPKYPEKKRKLKELANSLHELSNPILMFVTFKIQKDPILR